MKSADGSHRGWGSLGRGAPNPGASAGGGRNPDGKGAIRQHLL
jgi:hypothetical protein